VHALTTPYVRGSSSRLRSMASAVAALTPPSFSLLPPSLVLHVFSLLPADARARAACVCRGWRVTLDELSLWTRLDLSAASGVRVRVTDAVLAGVAAKARGQLRELDVSGCVAVTFDTVLAAVVANGGTLRELCVGARALTAQALDVGCVERLLEAAPQLTTCHADVFGDNSVAAARRMLHNEPPFEPLRLRALRVVVEDADADEATTLALVADLAAHELLKRVELLHGVLETLAALDVVVDVALAREMTSLKLWNCRLSPASAPALARLVGSGTLTELSIGEGGQLLDAPSAALLGAALRTNSTLSSLAFHWGFWQDAEAGAALLGALTDHVSLRTLNLSGNHMLVAEAVAGAALGALVAANAPALTQLEVSQSNLGDAGLRPLLEALPYNTHLRTLGVGDNAMSATFARDVLLPAVRANTSLLKLRAANWDGATAAMREAEALVANRADAA
jgi:hypothetical protein